MANNWRSWAKDSVGQFKRYHTKDFEQQSVTSIGAGTKFVLCHLSWRSSGKLPFLLRNYPFLKELALSFFRRSSFNIYELDQRTFLKQEHSFRPLSFFCLLYVPGASVVRFSVAYTVVVSSIGTQSLGVCKRNRRESWMMRFLLDRPGIPCSGWLMRVSVPYA